MDSPEETIAGIVARLKDARRPVAILHAVQGEFGRVPAAAVPAIADGLNLSRAEVHGVISSITTSARPHPAVTRFTCAAPKPARR